MALNEESSSTTKLLRTTQARVQGFFVRKSELSEKREINFRLLKAIAFSTVLLFIAIVLLLPDDQPVEFSVKREAASENTEPFATAADEPPRGPRRSQALWASPKSNFDSTNVGTSEVNHNTSMLVGSHGGNAKTQLRPGSKLTLRIIDKFTVSEAPVPILAELILNAETESGLLLPAGTRLY